MNSIVLYNENLAFDQQIAKEKKHYLERVLKECMQQQILALKDQSSLSLESKYAREVSLLFGTDSNTCKQTAF